MSKLEEKRSVLKKENVILDILVVIRYVSIFSIAFILIFNLCFKITIVEGNSMYPTIKNDTLTVSSLITNKLHDVKRFDIVSVKEGDQFITKRVIGLPNETIQYKDDVLYIDGKKENEDFLDKKYIAQETNNGEIAFTDDFGPLKLGGSQYFVVGDNRRISKDSRSVGAFHRSAIYSHDILVFK